MIMYSCIELPKPHSGKCVWGKKREFKFYGLFGNVNSNFIVQSIYNCNKKMSPDVEDLGFFFSTKNEVCMYKNGHKVYKFKNPLSLLDDNINILAIDGNNNLLMSKESGYYVLDVVRNTCDLAMRRRDNADKYDAAVDNVNKAIYFLQEQKLWSIDAYSHRESKLFKYSIVQKK